MRLIYLSNARLPTEKANGYQIMKMCEAFAAHDVSVTLAHPYRVRADSLQPRDAFDYYGVRRAFAMRELPSLDLRALLHDRFQQLWFLIQVGTNALSTLAWSLCHWRDRATIFYSRDPFGLTLLLLFRPLIRARIVYEAHVFPGRSRVWLLPLMRRLDWLVVITRKLHELFAHAGMPAEKTIVAPDAVDLKQFQIPDTKEECRQRLGLPRNRPTVGYIGRFQAMGMEKGIPELVYATAILQEEFPEQPPLLLCVGGPLEVVARYEEIARGAGLRKENMRFVDRVSHTQVPYWIRACDVCTIPWSYNEFSAHYTSPLKLFEYMAVGVPIVASDLPALCEILRDDYNAVLVAPGDSNALAAGIEKVLSDPPFAARLAAQAQRDVERYTWDRRAEAILQAIQNNATRSSSRAAA
jgi:glycosyltransferase involved in cell wall biosynthesis